jgi:hypothetical protein
MLAVRSNPTDARGQVNDDVGTRGIEQASHTIDLPQIAVRASGNDDIGDAALAQLPDDGGSQKAGPSGDDHTPAAPIRPAIRPAAMRARFFGFQR